MFTVSHACSAYFLIAIGALQFFDDYDIFKTVFKIT